MYSEEDVAIVIPLYGVAIDDPEWQERTKRAVLSATGQCPNVYVSKGEDLAEARNKGQHLPFSFLIFLDADDQLHEDYVQSMLGYVNENPDIDIVKPATMGINDDAPSVIPKRNLRNSNHIVIGAMIRRRKMVEAGGFRDLPALEDWDLWTRMHFGHGANIGLCEKAIYVVTPNETGRNSQIDAHRSAYTTIRRNIERMISENIDTDTVQA